MWGTLTGLTEPIGGAIGWLILANTTEDLHQLVYAVLFGLVAGMMTYISFKELIPTAYTYDRDIVPSSLFSGMFVMGISLVLFVVAR
jgi:ZIP family zinc transporter